MHQKGRIIFGLMVIFIGLGFLLDSTGAIVFDFKTWFPIILVAIGISGLFSRQSVYWNLFLIFLGIFLILKSLNIIPDNSWNYFWPSIIIVIGLSIIFGHFRPRSNICIESKAAKVDSTTDANDFPDYSSVFGGLNAQNSSQTLKGGRASAVFGATEIDMTNAKIFGEEITFSASASFGGIEITVPRDWQVIMTGTPFLGAIENKCANNFIEGSPRFRVNASAAFGAVTIKN